MIYNSIDIQQLCNNYAILSLYSHFIAQPSSTPGGKREALPTSSVNSEKYRKEGLYTEADFDHIPTELRSTLSQAANFSLSKSTWSTYKTSLNRLKDCETETKVTMTLPLDEKKILTFIGYLLKKGLAASTIESYLSGLRQAQIAAGMGDMNLRTPLIKQIIRGRKNQSLTEGSNTKTRLPITPAILKVMKDYIKKSELRTERKLLIWCIACTGFNGGFRIHEILPQNKKTFDPFKTLLQEDASLEHVNVNGKKVGTLQIRLKTEKTNRSKKHTIVDLYQSGNSICPIRAFTKWYAARSKTGENLPLFLDEEGQAFTGRRFNLFLDGFVKARFPEIEGRITSHSFRAGLATMLGQLGYCDEDIKSSGRWSSRAFLDYLKLPRTQRANMARELASMEM